MPKQSEPRNELDDLLQLVTSEHWLAYLKILKQRKIYLQSEVNKFVKAQNLMSAYGELCKMEDISKTLDMVSKRLTELKG